MKISKNPANNIVNKRWDIYLLEVNSSISRFSRDVPAAVQSHRDLFSVQFEQLQLQVMDAVRLASPCISQNTLPGVLHGLLDLLPSGIRECFGLHSNAVFTMTCIINCLNNNRNSFQYSFQTFYQRNGSELSQIPFLDNFRQ